MRQIANIVMGLLMIIAIGVLAEPFFPAQSIPRGSLFAAIVVAPILEELIFRGVVQRLLGRIVAPFIAVLVAAALFAVVHGTVQQMIVAFPCGVVLGYCYLRSGTLLVPIAIHALNNALAWLYDGATLREAIPDDTFYAIIYASCAVFLAINIIFAIRR